MFAVGGRRPRGRCVRGGAAVDANPLTVDDLADTFVVDAFPSRTFNATLAKLYNAPTNNQGVITYPAILSVGNEDGLLKPGMTASAQITVRTVEKALLVPSGALRFVPPAVLSAIIFPELLLRDGAWVTPWENPRLLAGVIAGFIAWRTRNVLLTIAVGLAAFWALGWAGM